MGGDLAADRACDRLSIPRVGAIAKRVGPLKKRGRSDLENRMSTFTRIHTSFLFTHYSPTFSIVQYLLFEPSFVHLLLTLDTSTASSLCLRQGDGDIPCTRPSYLPCINSTLSPSEKGVHTFVTHHNARSYACRPRFRPIHPSILLALPVIRSHKACTSAST